MNRHIATDLIRRRYDLIAPLYEKFEGALELFAGPWRRELWSQVEGPRILELGVGTGLNLRFHPTDKDITAIDISEEMLGIARRRAMKLGSRLRLSVADVQSLPFEDNSFDEVVASFLFCSVPDPVMGLREAWRVLRPGGRLLLLEHVLTEHPLLRPLMRWLDPVLYPILRDHIARETSNHVRAAGFVEVEAIGMSPDIIKFIQGRVPVAGESRIN